MLLVVTKSRKDTLGGPLLRFLHEAAGSLGGRGLDQQMEVLRHEHPSDQQECGLLPELPQDFNK